MKQKTDYSMFETRKRGIGQWLIVAVAIGVIGLMLILGLTGCQSTSKEGTRTETVAPDGTRTIVEQIDPFMLLQTKCLERKFE